MPELSHYLAKMISLWHRPAHYCKKTLNRQLTGAKCVMGKGSVVYDPALLLGHARESIRIGENTHVKGELMTFPGGRIEIGDYCYIGVNSHVWSSASIEMGNRVLVAHGVSIFDSQTHPLNPLERHQQFVHIIQKGNPENCNLNGERVIIEDDVWIACQCVILRGVTIGKAAVIGAGSVVTRSIPSWALAAGNPAKVIRELSHDERAAAGLSYR